jgi:hypothetical protein
MGSRHLVHHGTLALTIFVPLQLHSSTMAGKNTNTKYFGCEWYMDDQFQVFAVYPNPGGRLSVNKVCTVASVASSKKVRIAGKRNVHACIISDSSSKKTFTLASHKFSGPQTKKAGLSISSIAQLTGHKDSVGAFAGKKCCPVFLIQKCNVGIRISVLTFLRSVFCSQAPEVAWGLPEAKRPIGRQLPKEVEEGFAG